jgi:hypothetical protein
MGEPWEGVVSIPEGEVGTYRVKHFSRPAGEVERSNFRTAFIGGQGHSPLAFDRATNWHSLEYEGGVWVTDLPIEQQQHDDLLAPLFGSVLVGGLGIGYAATVLAANPDVDEVVVVEISPEVVELVGPHVRDPNGKVEIVTQDLFEFLRENDREFDWAFFDIWQSDGEGTFFDVVCPLRRLAWEAVYDHQIVCWNENVMRGQLFTGLQSRWAMASGAFGPEIKAPSIEKLATLVPEDEVGAKWINWSVPFFQACKLGVIDGSNLVEYAGQYAGTYGHMGFEFWWETTVERLAGAKA